MTQKLTLDADEKLFDDILFPVGVINEDELGNPISPLYYEIKYSAGTYSLTAKIANKYATNLEVKVDDVALVKSKALEATGDYSIFEEIALEKS